MLLLHDTVILSSTKETKLLLLIKSSLEQNTQGHQRLTQQELLRREKHLALLCCPQVDILFSQSHPTTTT